MKIFITGNAGSGKSTLGRQIASSQNLQYYSLDKIVWKEHWQKTPADEKKSKVHELLIKSDWVIDGVDYDTLESADVIVFLDIARRICFYRAVKRNFKYLFKSRPELPANCPEIKIFPKLVKIIWNFPKRIRPKILIEKTKRSSDSFIHIKNNKQLQAYLIQIDSVKYRY